MPTSRRAARVLLTDHPWEDLDVERRIIEGAGLDLVAGPVTAPDAEQVEALVAEADPQAILTCWAPVSGAAIANARALRIVARLGVGLDNIDVAAASACGAWVTNVPDYCVAEVSDHALALALSLERGIASLDRAVRSRGWHVPAFVPRRLAALTVGIVGYGRIGQASAAKFAAIGCRVIAYNPHPPASRGAASLVSLAELQAQADIVVLHAPLTEVSRHLVNGAFIAACQRRPTIVNVSRGGLIDNAALADALDRRALRGAALDVIDGEPSPPAALLQRDDVIVTPHIAYLSDGSLEELRRSACEEVVRVLAGEPPRHPRNAPSVPLPGGVSSDIRVIQGPDGEVVVKTALGRLKVAAEWLSNPARSSNEVAAIRAAAGLLGRDAVPEIVWWRPEQHSFAMRHVDRRLRNWKQDLLAGHVDPDTARAAGMALGRLHRRSMALSALAEQFADTTYFRELRVTPFFDSVAARRPDLAPILQATVLAMQCRAAAFVHGDYSPKNILADGADIVILDFEVAHWGDPRFDVAFCLSHLLLKAHRRSADQGALTRAALLFLEGYAAEDGPAPDDRDLVVLLGSLAMARLEGVSPVDYVDELDMPAMQTAATAMILDPKLSVRQLLAAAAKVA